MRTVKKPHIGNNIKSLLRQLDIKQDTLASGLAVSQQQVSKLLQKETIEDDVLEKIAGVMGIPVEAIEQYSDEAVVQFIGNTYHIQTSDNSNQAQFQFQPTFNYADKLVEYLEKSVKEKDVEIKSLKSLIDSLRLQIEELRNTK